jgi:hypothetical protein
MKHAHTADGVTYIANLTLVWDQVDFKIWRLASEAAPLTLAYGAKRDDLSSAGVSGNDPRIGDSLDVTGSGVNTEIWAGVRRIAGPHLVRFTSTDGENFTITRELTIPGPWANLTAVPTYRGLTVSGTGDSAVIWVKDGNHVIRRINAVTGAIAETIDTAVSFPVVHPYAGLKYFEEYGNRYLALVPATQAANPQPPGYVLRLGTPNALVANTESLAADPPQLNANGTGSADYDPNRKNLIFLWTNNSVSASHFAGSGLTAAKDWQLLQ